MARFLVDEQLPPALVRLLKSAGHQAHHIYDLGLGAAPDDCIWREAVARKAVLITKDGDFVARRKQSRSGPCIVWIRLGNTTPHALCATIEPLLNEVIDALDAGDLVVEVM
jgi:predicted nuclease of predicted toxin-antitoxin system